MQSEKLVAACAVAAIVTFVTLFSLRPLARKFGLVDKPDERKRHRGRVPLIGGLCFFLGTIAGMLYLGYQDSFILSLLATGTLILVTGLADDIEELSASARLLIQASAAALVILTTGIYIDGGGQLFGAEEFRLHLLGIPVTVIAVVGLINAFNMLDGIDGLAGGLAMVSILAILAFTGGGWSTVGVALLLQILCVALIPYLLVNMGWPDGRKVFMGDAGSTLIGFLLAWSLIYLSQAGGTGIRLAPVDVLWCVALPVMDTLSVMYRRMRRGLSPFKADRQHLHHLLLDAGFGARVTLALIILAAALLAWIGYVLRVLPELASLVAFSTLLAAYVLAFPQALSRLRRMLLGEPAGTRAHAFAIDRHAIFEPEANAMHAALHSGRDAADGATTHAAGATDDDTITSKPSSVAEAIVPLRTLFVMGAFPGDLEALPLMQELSRDERFDARICVTADDTGSAETALQRMGLDAEIAVIDRVARLDDSSTAGTTLDDMKVVFDDFRPDVVLVHGNSPATLATALVAYYQQIPLACVESARPAMDAASAQAFDANREIISTLSSLHLTAGGLGLRDVPAGVVRIVAAEDGDVSGAVMPGREDSGRGDDFAGIADVLMDLPQRHPLMAA